MLRPGDECPNCQAPLSQDDLVEELLLCHCCGETFEPADEEGASALAQ